MTTSFRALPNGFRLRSRYVVTRAIGSGRSSTVYEALDVETRADVALKVLDPQLALDEVALARFRREAEILRALAHPGTVRVFDDFQEGDLHVICMERVPGVDGKTWVKTRGTLSASQAVQVATQIAEALESCHRRGVLHRDLKPQNVLIDEGLAVKLVDFGISRLSAAAGLTRTGTILGTPEYMAPELFLHNRADPRSDVYGLGAVLYELLTGRPPIQGTSLQQVMTYHMQSEIPRITTRRPEVPEWLAGIVHKCLRIDPSARYQGCFELLADLRRGSRALASMREDEAVATCRACQGSRLARLPFCHHCGRFFDEVFAKGDCSVILNRCDEPRPLAEYVGRVYGAQAARALLAAAPDLPAVYATGVSREAAVALVHELSDFPCELEVVRSMPRQLRLPWPWLVAAMAGPALPVVVFGVATPTLAIAAAIVVTEALLLTRFLRKVWRVVLPLRRLRAATQAARDPLDTQVAERMKRLSDPALKTLLGRLYLAFEDARRRGADVKAVGILVDRAFGAAAAIEGHQAHLASRSLVELKGRAAALELRIRRAEGAGDSLTALVNAKAAAETEAARYIEVQDAHARLTIALLNLYATVRRIAEAAPPSRDEIAALEQAFAA